ncbi:MAG TPA: hypothetical protein VKC34_05880 [Blastocatellia bacterium]|nr:hypothetical protein [Blastocatellia bacterium]
MRKPISYDDAIAIKELCPSVTYVAPFHGPDNVAKVRYQDEDHFVMARAADGKMSRGMDETRLTAGDYRICKSPPLP